MEIREARVEDAEAIVELLNQLGYPGTERFIKDRITQLIDHPEAQLLVAEDQGKLLGMISLHFIPQLALAGDFCRISYFCVDDGARRAGIGTRLEARAVEEARVRGCDRIEVHCHSRRTVAHRFYERQGYQESPKYLVKRLGSEFF